MADVLMFHHAMGQTEGFHAFADALRLAGHTVHTPDLFDGRTFASIEAGLAHVEQAGFDDFIARGAATAESLPAELVYVGFSLGVLPAQLLGQTRAGAKGVVCCYSFVPVAEFGSWPDGLPVQVHGMDADPHFAEEGDLDAARELMATGAPVELYLYPGDQHYFADAGLPSYVPDAAELLTRRVLDFLAER